MVWSIRCPALLDLAYHPISSRCRRTCYRW